MIVAIAIVLYNVVKLFINQESLDIIDVLFIILLYFDTVKAVHDRSNCHRSLQRGKIIYQSREP